MFEPLGVEHVKALAALWPHRDQTCVGKHLKVLRYRLLADIEVRANLGDGTRLVSEERQDDLPSRLGQCSEDGFCTHEEREYATELVRTSFRLYKRCLVR